MVEIITSSNVDEDTVNKAVGTLTILSDPAAAIALTEVLEDLSQDALTRERASRVLSRCDCGHLSYEQKRAWQQSNDPILLLHAVRCADRLDGKFLSAMIANKKSALFKHVLLAMTNGFEEEHFLGMKIEALSHADANVREAACVSLYADQPRAAEAALLEAARDSVDDVANAALKTLMYYCSQSNLLALHEMILDGALSPMVLVAAKETFETVLAAFDFAMFFPFDAAQKNVDKYLRWLRPVKHLVRAEVTKLPRPQPMPLIADAARAARDSQRFKWTVVIPESGIYSTFDEASGKWAEKKELFNSINWFAIAANKRERIAKYLVSHPDPWIREYATHPLCAWLDDDSLLALLDDPVRSVRKRAAYWCQFLPPDPFFVSGLMRALAIESAATVHEIIAAYCVHEKPDVLPDKLVELALNERESVAFSSVEASG